MPVKEINGIPLTVELHKESSIVTTSTNVAGAFSKILEIEPNERQFILWPNGNILRLKLFATDGTEVEMGAELQLVLVEADGTREKVLAKFNYAPYHNLSMSNQWDPDREPNLAVSFADPASRVAVVGPGQKLELRLKSDVVVDWDYASGDNQTQFFASVGQDWATA